MARSEVNFHIITGGPGSGKAIASHDAAVAVYRELDYEPVEVPKDSISERVEFILDRIEANPV